jgi:hypothetical protein
LTVLYRWKEEEGGAEAWWTFLNVIRIRYSILEVYKSGQMVL